MKAIPGPYTMIALGETDKTHIEYQFDAKAVIIPLVSSTGHGHASMKRVKYCEGKFALGNILCAVIPKDESFVLAKYLHIYLHWNREELLVSQMKGMANVSLPMNRIADVMVTVPSIDKQREIIELENQLVEKEIETNKLFADQLTQLENLNQAILQEAVQGKLVPQDPNDEPASELLQRIHALSLSKGKPKKPLPPIKPEEIPFKIPENWVWCRLGEICDRIHYGFNASAKPNNTGVRLLRITDIQENAVDWNTVPGCDYTENDLENYLLNENDIVIARTGGTIGKTFLVKNIPLKALFASYLIRAIPSNAVFPEYLKFFMESPAYWKQLYDSAGGAAQPNVNGTSLSNLLVPLPPLSEQKRIVAEIERQLAKTKQLKEHIIANQQATEQLLKALLHQAFEVKEMETV
jgi:type I restriction enzyme S subunit